MTLSAISNSESYEKITKTVYLNDSKKYYRKLDNVTLRVKIHGEDTVTAKDIWLDALTCESDWLFTTSNISKRWNLPLKTTRKKMTLLSNSGLARHEKITDPKDGKILMHVWLFFETPQPPKPGHWVFDGTCKQNKVISEKPTAPEKGVVYHYKNKQQKEKTTTTTPPKSPPNPPPSPPPEEPLKSSVVVSLHEKIKPDQRVKVTFSTLEKALALYTEKQVETLISHINDPKKEIKNPAGYIHKACNEKWEIEEFDSSKIIDPEIQRKNQEENLQKQRDMTDESIKLKNIPVDGFFEGANQMRIAMGIPPKTKPTGKKNKQIQKPTNILEDKDKLDARKALLKLQLEQYRKAENDNKKDN